MTIPATLTVIPARMASQRLPEKPLRLIAGVPMIVHVWRCAVAASIGRVVVACDDEAIADAVTSVGGEAVITDPDLPSGSDRVAAALTAIDPEHRFDSVINLQGDLPEVPPCMLRGLADALARTTDDVVTPVAALKEDEIDRSSVVKAVVSWPGGEAPGKSTDGHSGSIGRALYFSRAAVPHGARTGSGLGARMWHHIGIYGWRRAALERFVALPPSPLEQAEKLEQLRALEADMRIAAIAVDIAVTGIDTEDDLAGAEARLSRASRRS